MEKSEYLKSFIKGLIEKGSKVKIDWTDVHRESLVGFIKEVDWDKLYMTFVDIDMKEQLINLRYVLRIIEVK